MRTFVARFRQDGSGAAAHVRPSVPPQFLPCSAQGSAGRQPRATRKGKVVSLPLLFPSLAPRPGSLPVFGSAAVGGGRRGSTHAPALDSGKAQTRGTMPRKPDLRTAAMRGGGLPGRAGPPQAEGAPPRPEFPVPSPPPATTPRPLGESHAPRRQGASWGNLGRGVRGSRWAPREDLDSAGEPLQGKGGVGGKAQELLARTAGRPPLQPGAKGFSGSSRTRDAPAGSSASGGGGGGGGKPAAPR